MGDILTTNWEDTLHGIEAKIRVKDLWNDYLKAVKILKDCGDIYIIHDPEKKSIYGIQKREVIIDGEK